MFLFRKFLLSPSTSSYHSTIRAYCTRRITRIENTTAILLVVIRVGKLSWRSFFPHPSPNPTHLFLIFSSSLRPTRYIFSDILEWNIAVLVPLTSEVVDWGSGESHIFSDISGRNNDYSDTLDARRGEVGVVKFFVLKVPDYESAMLIYKQSRLLQNTKSASMKYKVGLCILRSRLW